MDTGTVVTAGIFVAGLVFQLGRLSKRVEAIEAWRVEVAGDVKKISSVVDRIDAVLRREYS